MKPGISIKSDSHEVTLDFKTKISKLKYDFIHSNILVRDPGPGFRPISCHGGRGHPL